MSRATKIGPTPTLTERKQARRARSDARRVRRFLGPSFVEWWVTMLWQAMRVKGEGYKVPSLRHTGRGDDRRADKLESAKAGATRTAQRYMRRYSRA